MNFGIVPYAASNLIKRLVKTPSVTIEQTQVASNNLEQEIEKSAPGESK